MSQTIDPSFKERLHRILTYELIARRRVPIRRDWRKLIQSSDLPEPAKNLISRTVKRTRLWRSERADVANELIAHFIDAREGGASIEDAITDFGNPVAAAKLISSG